MPNKTLVSETNPIYPVFLSKKFNLKVDYSLIKLIKLNQKMNASEKKTLTVAVYSKDPPETACSTLRLFDPLTACNWNIIWKKRADCAGSNFNVDYLNKADLIIIQRDFPCRKTANILSYLISLKIPIIYDIDDYLLDNHKSHQRHFYFKTVKPYIEWVIKEADVVTVSTTELKKKTATLTNKPVIINKNLVNQELFYAPPSPRADRINILISGTPTHKNDWKIIIDPINEISKKYGNEVNVIFFGIPPKFFLNNPLIKRISSERDYVNYARQLRALNIHFALIPLENTIFNHCKSNIKWLEYSAAGIPGIYSNLPPYNSCIKHNETGLLVNNDPESWFDSMEELIVNPEKASKIARNAQDQVIAHYSIQTSISDYSTVFFNMANQTRTAGLRLSAPTCRPFSDTANIIMDKISILHGILTE